MTGRARSESGAEGAPSGGRRILRLGCLLVVAVAAAASLFSWRAVRWWRDKPSATEAPTSRPAVAFPLATVQLPQLGASPGPDLATFAANGRCVVFLCDMRAISDGVVMAWATAIGEAKDERGDDAVKVVGILEAPELPAVLRGAPARMLARFAAEFPFEMRIDFGGAVRRSFGFEDRAAGVVLAGPGDVMSRLSGVLDDERRAALRGYFGLERRPAFPQVADARALLGIPELRAGAPLGIVFLARPVSQRDAPAARMSPLALLLSGFEPPADPSIRLVTFLAGAGASTKGAEIVIVGELEGFDSSPWRQRQDDPALRAALGVGIGEPAFIAIDETGAIRVRAAGTVPMWRLGAAAEVLGLPPPGS